MAETCIVKRSRKRKSEGSEIMVLTDRQRSDLHSGIHEYLQSQTGEAFARAAAALAEADPDSVKQSGRRNNSSNSGEDGVDSLVPILEKKWTAVPRLQRRVLELERAAAQNARIHAHRVGTGAGNDGAGGTRRMLPRPPCVHTLKGHSGVVGCVAVHPVYTVACSGGEDGTIKVWDHESGEYVRTLKGHTNTVNSLDFTPSGSHLASSSSDLSIKLWDFTTHTCIRTLRGHDHTISAVRFIPSSISTISSSVAPTGVSGGSSDTPAAGEATSSSSATGIDPTISGTSILVSASRDRTVKFWDMETGFCDKTLSDHADWVRCIAVRASDGSMLATSGNDFAIMVYDVSTGASSGGGNSMSAEGSVRKVGELRGHEHVVESVAFVTSPTPAAAESALAGGAAARKSPSTEASRKQEAGDYLVSGARDRTVRLWKISTEECVAVFKSHENWVRSVILHPTANYIISAGDDRTIRVFDIKSNRCLRTIDSAHPHFVTTIAMHHTLPILVSGGVDQTVKCWQLD